MLRNKICQNFQGVGEKNMLTLFASLFVFGLLVLVHEWGHFVAAKLTGMRVDEFAIGFGPKIFSRKKGETIYSIRAVPLGGFNDIAGMTPEKNEAGERGFCQKPIWARMITIVAGAAMNFVLPIIIFTCFFYFSGVQTYSSEPKIGSVIPNKPAAVAGFQKDDVILSINGKKISTWQMMNDSILQNDGKILEFEILRNNQPLKLTVTPKSDAQLGKVAIGIMASSHHYQPTFFEATRLSLQRTKNIVIDMIKGLGELLHGKHTEELAGPIGIVQLTGEVAKDGIVSLLSLAALLSINLGIVNLLPIPALDGGHVVLLLVEGLYRKPLPAKAVEAVQIAGIVTLIGLMLFATKNDVFRLMQ